ncbi:MAG: hypothetical protein ACTHJ5_19800 [Ilyomonas sp.]
MDSGFEIGKKWFRLAYNTEPVNIKRAGKAIDTMYAEINLKPPRKYLVDNPVQFYRGVLEINHYRETLEFGNDIFFELFDYSWPDSFDPILPDVLNRQWEKVGKKIIWTAIYDYAKTVLPYEFKNYGIAEGCCYGTMDGRRIFYYALNEKKQALCNAAAECGLFYVWEKACLICDKPRKMKVTRSGELIYAQYDGWEYKENVDPDIATLSLPSTT